MQWILMLAVFSNGPVDLAPLEEFSSYEECIQISEQFNQALQEKGYTQSATYCKRTTP